MIIKNYFLCALACSSLGLVAMENSSVSDINTEVQRIIKKIEEKHLAENKDRHWIAKSFYDFVQARSLTYDQVTREMKEIESYIQWVADKKVVLQQLQEHWYVKYLIDTLVEKTITEIEEVRGSTIDTLYNRANESVAEKIVHDRVMQHFHKKLDINDNVLECIPEEASVIHCQYLPESDKILLDSLEMSSDGQYLRATNFYSKSKITWGTQSARTIDLMKESQMLQADWIPAEKSGDFYGWLPEEAEYSVAHQRYYATAMKALAANGGFKKRTIVLYQRPDMESHVGEMALINSQNSLEELEALSKAKCITAIKGFAGDNLKLLIEEAKAELKNVK